MQPELLTVIHGCMFAAKSKMLVQIYESHTNVLAFKPKLDEGRYGSGANIASKDSRYRAPAIVVDERNPRSIFEYATTDSRASMVIIDEVNFFTPVSEFIGMIGQLTDAGIEVVVAGLSHFATKEPWGPILPLLDLLAINNIQLFANCDFDNRTCNVPAVWTYQKYPHEKIMVEGEGAYGASCDKHYSSLHKGVVYER